MLLIYKCRPFLFLLFLLVTSIPFSHAANADLNLARNKIKQLDQKINQLKIRLANAHDKQTVVNEELSQTEKKISEGIQKSRTIHQEIRIKQNDITELQAKVSDISQQLHEQQTLLTKHLRARYKMGEYQPLKWLLNQDNPYAISRLFTYYHYLIQSRQSMIDNVQLTQKQLKKSTLELNNEISSLEKLQSQLIAKQQKLNDEKRYQQALVQSITTDILTNEQSLKDTQQNKAHLSELVNTLVKQSLVSQLNYPFVQMKKKLPRPVHASINALQEMNQGVTFFADEGESVNAVYTGKIVFSDWLKGYGLLLIIDHGQGFMTLYAHNQSLFKHKGDKVNQGEQIATVGHSGGLKENGLYFEVRHHGKAMPPLKWLS